MQRSLKGRLDVLEQRAQAGGPLLVAFPDDDPPRYRVNGCAVSLEVFEQALPLARAIVRVLRRKLGTQPIGEE